MPDNRVPPTPQGPVEHFFVLAERVILVLIALLAISAAGIEIAGFVEVREVSLADLLLLFIYLEVVGMAAAYYISHRIPETLPILIAITGITRLIILQGKDLNPSILLYESGAILTLSASYALIKWVGWKFPRKQEDH